MVNIVIQGVCGRMGHALVNLISQRSDCKIVAGIDKNASIKFDFPVYSSLNEMDTQADVLIDFSLPEASRSALAYCKDKGLAHVLCTTGLDKEDDKLIQLASKETPVFRSANMSLGINLLTELGQRAQKVLNGFDIEIVEKHHHNKLDAPSGTALALADAINEQADGRYHYMYNRQPLRQPRDPNEIGIHAVRGGTIVGEHDVIFAGPDEVVTLSHTAYSRDVFANGAIAAALYLAGKPAGLYSMKDLMEAL